jgi:hypothetical protein
MLTPLLDPCSRILIHGWIAFICKIIKENEVLFEFFISTESDQNQKLSKKHFEKG